MRAWSLLREVARRRACMSHSRILTDAVARESAIVGCQVWWSVLWRPVIRHPSGALARKSRMSSGTTGRVCRMGSRGGSTSPQLHHLSTHSDTELGATPPQNRVCCRSQTDIARPAPYVSTNPMTGSGQIERRPGLSGAAVSSPSRPTAIDPKRTAPRNCGVLRLVL